MKTTSSRKYKVNGHTFLTDEKVNNYCLENNYLITDTTEFTYKDSLIICVNVKSK